MASGDDKKPVNPVGHTEISDAGVPPVAEDASFVGEMVAGRYRIESVLGRGGMGTVYLGEHVQLKKRIAIKMLAHEFRNRPDLAARFLKEARAAAQIGHPNIVDVFDLGELPGGGAFIAMALLEGDDLAAEIQRVGPIPFTRARTIVGQICRALAAAHSKGVTHRDMKPANVFLARDTEGEEQVKILDFGIAQVSDAENDIRLTQTGAIVGTPAFMSPEQGRGLPTDHRADIYSVGCILYNMLTGGLVFDGPNAMAVITRHIVDPPVPPSQRAPAGSVSPDLDAVVLRALAKEPADRYQTMKELWLALESLSDAPMAWPDSTSGRFETVLPSGQHAALPALERGITTEQVVVRPKRSFVTLGLSIAAGACVAGGAWWLLSPRASTPAPAQVSANDVSLELSASVPDAKATIRGKSYPLPLRTRLSRNGEAEMIEVTAPDAQPYRTWITLDRDRQLEVALAAAAPSPSAPAPTVPPAPTAAPVATAPIVPSPVHKPGAHGKAGAKTSAPIAAPVATPAPAATPAPSAPPPPPATAAPAPTPPPVVTPTPPPQPAPKPVAAPAKPVEIPLQALVGAHRAQVDACIAEDPSASGRLGYRLLVNASGAIDSAQLVEAEHRYPAIERCLGRALSSWRVTPPGRPAMGRVSIDLD